MMCLWLVEMAISTNQTHRIWVTRLADTAPGAFRNWLYKTNRSIQVFVQISRKISSDACNWDWWEGLDPWWLSGRSPRSEGLSLPFSPSSGAAESGFTPLWITSIVDQGPHLLMSYPANMRRWPKFGLLLGQRRRRWTNSSLYHNSGLL